MDEKIQNGSANNMREMQCGLERLERREWWRWGTALLIMLLLTLGVFSLSLPGLRRDAFTQSQLEVAVKGLFALVLLFDIFAIYQQVQISRLRRQLARQIGMLAAMETLKPAPPEEQEGQKERRRTQRRSIDQRLKVTVTLEDDKEETFHGRVIDVSEIGLGAVIAGSLNRGQIATLEFRTAANDDLLKVIAVVRYARGFRHGFEFSGLNYHEQKVLQRSCEGESVTVA